MDSEHALRMEHFALETTLSLEVLCARLRDALSLPPFEFDYENKTEWGLVEVDGIEYNVSVPYAAGTLREWDPSVPDGCNVGIVLLFGRADSRSIASWVDTLTRALALPVQHHRSR